MQKMSFKGQRFCLFAAISVLFMLPSFAHAQAAPAPTEPVISVDSDGKDDKQISKRVTSIYSQIGALTKVEVSVQDGVVTLTGEASNDDQAATAVALAKRTEGVVTVNDSIKRSLDLRGNVAPVLQQLSDMGLKFVRGLPLFGIAILIFIIIIYIGFKLANWKALWSRIAANVFLADLIGQAVKVVVVVSAIIVSLSLVGANTLIGTILGGAGVVGIAIGFAVRDTLENYISSIMLSLRQPFRPRDLVVIDSHLGTVVRLTSRATILMTPEGNHLRIPNSAVFKSVILNYSRNPKRRFEFILGVDADDDPILAIKACIDALDDLAFVLQDPKPNAVIDAVGDSNIAINVMGWVDQAKSDFQKCRSLAIRAAKDALEKQGFSLPEPIYRLRFDSPELASAMAATSGDASIKVETPDGDSSGGKGVMDNPLSRQDESGQKSDGSRSDSGELDDAAIAEIVDIRPDTHIIDEANRERENSEETDLLDESRPVE